MRLAATFSLALLASASAAEEPSHLASSTTANTSHATDSATVSSAEEALRRNAEVASRLAGASARGVRKMSADEGEKFFLEYWQFGDDPPGGLSERDVGDVNGTSTSANEAPESSDLESTVYEPSPAELFSPRSFPYHSSFGPEGDANTTDLGGGLKGRWRSLLESRDFKCPTGTYSCASIGRSDRCCGTGDTCEIVRDTGSGDVGCCPNGATCAGTVGSCQSGYTACSAALGGGCCIPGYECVSGGCAYVSVVTVTVHSSVTVSTQTYSTTPQSSHSSSSISTSSSSTQSSDTLVPPARPTSLSTATSGTTSRVDVCPTGFYACSAVYHGGCCQTGRDCDTTSCPTTSSTTFTSDGVTLVEPVTTGGSSHTTGKCAHGWFSCADTAGGGCCPTGFACGSSCTATAAKTTVAKEQATSSGSNMKRVGRSLVIWVFMWMWWIW